MLQYSICRIASKFIRRSILNNSSFRRKHGSPPCDEMYEDDGIAPRLLIKKYSRVKKCHREQRLCKQIAGVLSIIFSGACCDERLCMLGIKSVEPAPDTTCLRVTVFPLYGDPQPDPVEIILLLKSAKGYLRKEVAAEISRRRIPDFTFRVIVDPDYFL